MEGDHEHLEASEPAAAPAAAGPVSVPSGPTPTAGRMTPANVMALQRTAGNASVSRMLATADVRARTERATGYDLSGVSVQGGSPLADRLGVEAVTVGDEVHLGSATASPGTAHGDHVLAHELAHAVQQGTGQAGTLAMPGQADAMERAAERTAEASRASVSSPAPALRPLPAPAARVAQAYDPRYHRRALVHGLTGSGFAAEDIGKIYAANWERDMSQAHPALAAVALRWKEIKMAAVKGETPLDGRIAAFDAAVDHCISLGTLLKITSGEAYGGYRFYEHMDNPGAEPELDPKTAEVASKRMLREALREQMYADAGGIPQYMADGRDYVKAQLVRAAESYKGTPFDETSAAGKTRDAWAKREEALRDIVKHDPDRPIIEGQDPGTAVIAAETAQQAKELAAAGEGASYDGERVTPPTPPPAGVPAPASEDAPPAPADAGPAVERLPLSGPRFNAEVDRRFWGQNPDRAGERLDPAKEEDAPYIQKWLALRDQVRAEWKARNEERARVAAEQARVQKEADEAAAKEAEEKAKAERESETAAKDAALNAPGNLPPEAADALGRASHALEDFWSHSNFIELALGIKLSIVNPGSAPITGKPGDVDTKLQTSTFSGTDSSHSLSHKIRAMADEIEQETALVNRVTGKSANDPGPGDIGKIGSEAPVRETHEEGMSVDEARENDPTMQEIEKTVKDEALEGGFWGGLAGAVGGAAVGFLVGGPVGALIGGVAGGIGGAAAGGVHGAQEGIKKAGRGTLTTPAGVALLRRLAEGMEDETRGKQEEGGHSQIAKDQPGHHKGDPLNDLRTFRFDVSQECAVRADAEVIGGMRKVLDSPPEAIDAAMQAQLELVDKLIGPPSGHPYEAMVKKHQERAEELMTELAEAREGGHAHEGEPAHAH